MAESLGDVKALRKRFEELRSTAEKLEEEILELRQRRDELNTRVKEMSAHIRALREKLREVSGELRDVREKCRDLLSKIRELRKKRNAVREDLKKLREARAVKIAELKELRGVTGGRRINLERVEEEFRRLEWEYQTKPLTPEIERYYVERLTQLESILASARRYTTLRSEIEELSYEISRLRETYSKLSGEISELSEEYGKLKERLSSLIEDRDALRDEIKQLIEERNKLKEEANKAHNSLMEKRAQLKALREELEKVNILLKATILSKKVEERRKRMYQEALKVYEKYKRGESLSLEEFKLLVEFNLIK